MKRLMSVIILAGAPIACGTQTPSAPEAISLASDNDEATVSALARGRGSPRTCVEGDRSGIRAIGVQLVDRGKHSVTVRAVVVESSTDPSVTPCLTPSWDVTPDARVETINSEMARIHGGTGRYKVTATTAISRTLRLSATAKIAID